MPRANLETQRISRTGLDPAYTAANADGHAVGNDGRVVLHVKNSDTVAHTVTAVTPRKVDGLDVADLAVSVPAGGERLIGPFPTDSFSITLDVDYDATTGVTIAALRY